MVPLVPCHHWYCKFFEAENLPIRITYTVVKVEKRQIT